MPEYIERGKNGDKFVVVSGYYDNDTLRSKFIQAIGTYNDKLQAFGKALLHISELADGQDKKITLPFVLENETGYGIEVRHEKYTDYCYILFN